MRVKLERLVEIRSKLASLEEKTSTLDDEVRKIEADQKRLRENIEALSKTPEAKVLITRYISKAGEQETRLEEIEKERRSLDAQRQQLATEQATEIRNFAVD